MTTEVLTKEQLINLGFKECNDPIFPFYKSLVDTSQLSEEELGDFSEEDLSVVFGGRGLVMGEGFYLVVGASLLKLGFNNVSDVLIWVENIVGFEEF